MWYGENVNCWMFGYYVFSLLVGGDWIEKIVSNCENGIEVGSIDVEVYWISCFCGEYEGIGCDFCVSIKRDGDYGFSIDGIFGVNYGNISCWREDCR